jgi:hypothetical protein
MGLLSMSADGVSVIVEVDGEGEVSTDPAASGEAPPDAIPEAGGATVGIEPDEHAARTAPSAAERRRRPSGWRPSGGTDPWCMPG